MSDIGFWLLLLLLSGQGLKGRRRCCGGGRSVAVGWIINIGCVRGCRRCRCSVP